MPLTESYHEPLTLAAEQRLPAFVSTRLDEYYMDRVEKMWGGENLFHWAAPGPNAIYLSSNDYLCIAAEPALIEAQATRLRRGDADMLMSSVFLQEGSAQPRLEKKLAGFMGAEDGLITQSGWSANVGLLQTIAGPGVPVYLDMLAHASLWEGAHAAQARPVPFVHNEVAHLRRQVQKHGSGVIVVDAVYSTNGSLCPLAEILAVAEESGCILVVDESHSLGTHGPKGAGLVAQLGLSERVHFRTTSLSKAFGGRAGFITCSSKFKSYFLVTSRPSIFSSCLLGHELSWFDAALDFIRAADGRRAALHRNARRIREGLSVLGYNVSDGTEQIIALEVGTETMTHEVRKALNEEGIFGAVFCTPATPKNRALVRLTLNSGLTEVEVQQILHGCAAIREKVRLPEWTSSRRMAAAAG